MSRILLADDEATVRRAFKSLFESEGYSVRAAKDGEEAVALFDEEKPDIVLLDVMMPKKNGIAACREIRERDKLVPVLFFTAAPDDAALVRAFGAGADDYIDKTKSPEEFVARVASALRRAAAAESASSLRQTVFLGRTKVDFSKMTATPEDGEETRLTKSEALVLSLLVSRRGSICSPMDISSALGGEGYETSGNTLAKLMSRLKARLGAGGNLIINERGHGYMLLD
jgi:DNA-binding response OmpR family regulator